MRRLARMKLVCHRAHPRRSVLLLRHQRPFDLDLHWHNCSSLAPPSDVRNAHTEHWRQMTPLYNTNEYKLKYKWIEMQQYTYVPKRVSSHAVHLQQLSGPIVTRNEPTTNEQIPVFSPVCWLWSFCRSLTLLSVSCLLSLFSPRTRSRCCCLSRLNRCRGRVWRHRSLHSYLSTEVTWPRGCCRV